jgi:hypothetical protein
VVRQGFRHDSWGFQRDWRREYVRATSPRTKARAARLYNECSATTFDVCAIVGCGIESEVTDKGAQPAVRPIDVVLDDFVIMVVGVGIGL